MTTTNNNNTSSSNTSSDVAAAALKPPTILWAQRADKLFLTVVLEDCKNPTIKLDKDKLYFKGKSDSIQQDADHQEHEVTVDFFKPINVDESKHTVRARNTEFVIIKEDADWWPRLLKDSTKRHWLRVDFPRWKDEDDSDDEMAAGGGMGGMPGMPGMAGMGGGFGGQPEFSDLMQQLGSMGGGAGDMMGGLGGGPDGDDEYESDDDDTEQNPPDLEG